MITTSLVRKSHASKSGGVYIKSRLSLVIRCEISRLLEALDRPACSWVSYSMTHFSSLLLSRSLQLYGAHDGLDCGVRIAENQRAENRRISAVGPIVSTDGDYKYNNESVAYHRSYKCLLRIRIRVFIFAVRKSET
jgi:hypothetical protein